MSSKEIIEYLGWAGNAYAENIIKMNSRERELMELAMQNGQNDLENEIADIDAFRNSDDCEEKLREAAENYAEAAYQDIIGNWNQQPTGATRHTRVYQDRTTDQI